MNLTLDDLSNIRDALNEKIHALVMQGSADMKAQLSTRGAFGRASALAETRDKIQAEIDQRTNTPA